MKICILDSSDFISFPVGGQISFLLDFIKEVAKENLDLYLVGITRQGNEEKWEWSSRTVGGKEFPFFPIFKIDQRSKNKYFPFRLQILLSALRSKKKLLQTNYEVLYVHTPELLFPFVYPKQTKIIVHTHGLWEHTVKFSRYNWVRNHAIDTVFKKYVKLALQRADDVIVVNTESLGYYRSLFPSHKDKFKWIPTGVDLHLFRPMEKKKLRELYGFHEEDEVIIFSGRLSWNKGLDLLLESFKLLSAEVPRARLVIVGDGEQKSYLVNRALALQIRDRTFFLGEKSRSELPMILNCADIFALPSFIEGFPMAVLESLACGVPVVAVDVGDVSKLVIKGVTGYTVAGRDPKEFKKQLSESLIKHDTMVENCLKLSHEYAMSSIAQKILGVLRNNR
jgi:glycosyltransferase involved in cell wall biosynthesis